MDSRSAYWKVGVALFYMYANNLFIDLVFVYIYITFLLLIPYKK